MYNFEGKRILLTGASKGLGAVTAKAFADNGAKMVITARSADLLDKLKNSLHNPDKHLAFVADLTQPDKSKELVKESETHLGGIDVVIHCAGGGLGLKDPLLSLQDFRKWVCERRIKTKNLKPKTEKKQKIKIRKQKMPKVRYFARWKENG